MVIPWRFIAASILASCAVVSVVVAPVAAQQATITGRVTDAASGEPVAMAQVSLVGTNLVAETNRDGLYTLRGATPGSATVRVLRLGYGEESRQVTVIAGESVTLDIDVRPTAIALSPVVVTATGEQRRIEVGNAIASVNASQVVETQAVSNMADLLTARAAGVYTVPGTQVGAGTRIRIRGNSSISLTNNPIFIIDGIRVEGTTGSASIGVGGSTPTRINDINPEEIESIEIAKGPSAATLYGTDAANGVVVIRTKRGVAGRTEWNYYTEQTAITDRNDYPDAFWGWTTGATPQTTSTRSNSVQCFLVQVAAGACSQDSVTSYNLHKDPEATPFGVGYRQQHGLQLRGGSEAVRYFLHGEWETEDGVTKIPDFDQRWLAERGASLRSDQRNPNGLKRYTARSNLDIGLGDNADLAVNLGYTSETIRLTRSDDAGVPGLATNTYGGPGYKYMLNTDGDTLYGYRTYTPRDIYQATTAQDVQRVIGSFATNWRPQDWIGVRGTFGVDYIHRKESQLCRFEECPVSGQDHLGFKRDNRSNFFTYTLDGAATATRAISPELESKTTAGVQFVRNTFDRNGARGNFLPPGGSTVGDGAEQIADEANTETRTLGGFVEQHLAFRDRLFVTGALRSDRNSAFGADFKTVFYPKLSVSWVVSDEPFFPAASWLDQLRLRTAFGASGVQPSTTAALEYYDASSYVGESGEQPGVVYRALGNRELKPERSTELEFGFDLTFWDDRVSTEITYYNKNSRDALIERVLPPSVGTGLTGRFENLGEVRNWGWEGLFHARLIERAGFGWDFLINAATNNNELVSLGGVPPIVGAQLQQREGYPLQGWWSRRIISWNDANDDRIITANEVVVSDTAEYHGPSLPRREVAVSTGFDFLQRRFRLSGMADYKGGHLVYNNSERIRCSSRNNCSGLINPDASLFEQARTVATRQFGTNAGFFEDGDFIRLRELSLTFNAPVRWANAFRGRNLTATLAARNLGILWTKYTGVDPEAFGTTGDAPSSFQAFAPPTYFTLRLNLGF